MDLQDKRVNEPWNSVKILKFLARVREFSVVETHCFVDIFHARRHYI